MKSWKRKEQSKSQKKIMKVKTNKQRGIKESKIQIEKKNKIDKNWSGNEKYIYML